MADYIGRSVPRVDGREKVTGQAQFVADLNISACAVKVVRSDCAHGLIKRIDVNDAKSVPGVIKVITGREAAGAVGVCRLGPVGMCITDQSPLARDKVRFFGEPVACVVAVNEQAAGRAAALIRAEYQELPPLLDPEAAFRDRTNLIHPDLGSYPALAGFKPWPKSNVFHHCHIERGDLEKAWAAADLIVENRFTVPLVQHVQIEPHGAVGIYQPGDGLTMISSTQAPFVVREALSRLLELPQAKVRISAPYLGGGFGGKSDLTIEPLLAVVLAHVPGKWCRLILEREDVFTGTVLGRGLTAYYKTGVRKDGTLVGAEIKLYWNGGGYGDYSINIVTGGAVSSTGPYQIANIAIDSYGVYTNTPPVGAYRGYGHPEAHWCAERQLDMIAAKLGLSPVEIRLKNCLGPKKINAIGQVMEPHNGDLRRCIEKAAEAVGLGGNIPAEGNPLRGCGLAAFGKFPVMPTNAQSGAIIKANRDGTLLLTIGAVEMGQGVNTVMAQMLATALEIDIGRVQVVKGVDTDHSPYEWQTVASHSTWAVGNAVLRAAADFIAKLRQVLAVIYETDAGSIAYQDGWFTAPGREEKIDLASAATGMTGREGRALNSPVIGVGTFVPEGLTYLDPRTGQGNMAADWTFGCQAADVEINPDSGKVIVHKLVTAIDAGRIINRQAAAEQIKGAMVQALGATLSEKMIFGAKGEIRNANLVDYKIPTAADVPTQLETYFVETPEATGPFGARGLGEHGAVAVAPAVANAVCRILGIQLYDLFIDRDAIIRGLLDGGNDGEPAAGRD
ncbi:MAG: xanthine dehydrogenase family protein molybdopterin-binding subunit [Negativicutes bacterium]|nr:xanthine dehydrogenase family protein molybdopterin-binding subunit [Negativicutes bacterium]